MVTPVQRIPALLGGGFFKPPVYQQLAKKVVQQKVPALLRKDSSVYTKSSA
jgi:hypothetical protein